jgi:hypothetical protein
MKGTKGLCKVLLVASDYLFIYLYIYIFQFCDVAKVMTVLQEF